MTKDPRVYLAHILECLQRVERFTAGGKGRFFEDAMVQDAVLRNFEVMGEAAKRVEEPYRLAHPEIAWKALARLRDVLIHQYEGVDLARVWAVVEQDLPSLRRAISTLLPPLDELERELAGEGGMSDENKS